MAEQINDALAAMADALRSMERRIRDALGASYAPEPGAPPRTPWSFREERIEGGGGPYAARVYDSDGNLILEERVYASAPGAGLRQSISAMKHAVRCVNQCAGTKEPDDAWMC